MDLLKIGLVSDKVDAYVLRDAADWLIKPRLLAVPGVAHAIVFGGQVSSGVVGDGHGLSQAAWMISAVCSLSAAIRL